MKELERFPSLKGRREEEPKRERVDPSATILYETEPRDLRVGGKTDKVKKGLLRLYWKETAPGSPLHGTSYVADPKRNLLRRRDKERHGFASAEQKSWGRVRRIFLSKTTGHEWKKDGGVHHYLRGTKEAEHLLLGC